MGAHCSKTRQFGTLILFSLLLHSNASVASAYDSDTGIIDVTCLEGVVNGQSVNKIRAVQLMLEGDTLRVVSLSKTENPGPCDATLDLLSLTYRDVIAYEGEDVEITASLVSGLTLGISGWVTRLDLIANDVTLAENDIAEVELPSGINLESLEVLLQGGDAAPDFVMLLGNILVLEPGSGDAGVYSLRLEWDDLVETLEITVLENMEGDLDLSVQPQILPDFSSLNLYSASSPFNTRIPENPDLDPDSETLAESIVASMQFVVQVNQYSTPVYLAGNETPKSTVQLACGEVWELGITEMTGIPVPEWAEASFDADGDPPVSGCGEDSGQDNFMVILDLDNRCEYDFWQARKEGESWTASFGVGVSMDGSGVNPHGLSARGSGFAFLGGVIWPDEILAGRINHPLAFSYEFTKAGGPVAPATDSDGLSTEAFALPEGAIIQLDPSFDLDSMALESYERTIAVALQEYGMILVDSGSAGPVGFYAIDPDSVTGDMWGEIWGNEDYVALENLDPAALPFRVLALGPQNAAYQEELALNTGTCSAYQ